MENIEVSVIVMKEHMFGLAVKQFQIFRAIVIFYAVYVVDNLFHFQSSTQSFLHYQTRLTNISSFRNKNKNIPSGVNRFSWMTIIKTLFGTIFTSAFSLTDKLVVGLFTYITNMGNFSTSPIRIFSSLNMFIGLRPQFTHPLQHKGTR